MQWAIAFLIRHPKVQEKVKEELEQVVGNDRLVNVGDRSKLPYVNATILVSFLLNFIVNNDLILQNF